MKYNYLLVIFLFGVYSCSPKLDPATYREYQNSGNDISAKVQATLLSNVAQAIQQGGTEHAVGFCNLQAASIIDSLNQEYDCKISRVSDKNRNPNNKLLSEQEIKLWEIFKNGTLTDTLIAADNNLVFYKSIHTGMPACLKCHGNPDSDIDPGTFQKIQKLYPNDMATGYHLNELRGMWRIEFTGK
jgi:hypothetical protein